MNAQQKILLKTNDSDTTQGFVLSYFTTEGKHARAAVIICPGGGYGHVAMNHEGIDAARWLNSQGFDAFVLRYRVTNKNAVHHYPHQLNDVKAAIKCISKMKYKRIGLMGFSAGGHLAATYITEKKHKASFGILLYPVITTDSLYRHKGSFNNLLGEKGKNPGLEFSAEKRVNKKTPPVWLMHCKDDRGVPWQNSKFLYDAIISLQPTSQIHLYEKCNHGFGMNKLNNEADEWKQLCAKWLEQFK